MYFLLLGCLQQFELPYNMCNLLSGYLFCHYLYCWTSNSWWGTRAETHRFIIIRFIWTILQYSHTLWILEVTDYTFQTAKFNHFLYECNWYRFNKINRNMFLIILGNSIQPFSNSFFGLIHLNYELILNVSIIHKDLRFL